MSTESLGPQFLFHGTASSIKGDKILPAKVHGGLSHWGDAGTDTRGEPANAHAWAVPDEARAWDFAMDRVIHTRSEQNWNPRARVYALHPNAQQSAGHDASIPGEVKAPHFDIAERRDTMPERQGTFPEINWNNHTVHTAFTDDEDANHPRNLSVQFGHRYSQWGDHPRGPLLEAGQKEDTNRRLDRLQAVASKMPKNRDAMKDDPLPGMPSKRY